MGTNRAFERKKLTFLLAWCCCAIPQSLGHRDFVESPLTAIDGNGIATFPLIPHHVQRRRRELETGEIKPKTSRHPSHYSRFLQERANASSATTNNTQQAAALFQGYGTHFVDLWCGTPPQRQTVIVDTGSSLTAFPCSECQDCGVPEYHIGRLFSENKSSTFVKSQCDECSAGYCDESQEYCSIQQSYAEGSSWYAYEAQDVCYLGAKQNTSKVHNKGNKTKDPFQAPDFSFDLKFGCQNAVTGLFKTQLEDGIMGMDKDDTSYWKQMYDAHKISRSAFSLCFSRSDLVSREGIAAGAMTLGGADTRLHKTPMVYTSGDDSWGSYRVQVRKAYLRQGPSGNSAANLLQKKIIPLNASEAEFGRVIVDSGTTDTYFMQAFGTYFTEAFRIMTGETYSNYERTMTPDEVDQYPTILFQLYGDVDLNKAVVEGADFANVTGLAGSLDPENPYDVILAIPPSHYFEYDADQGQYAARFYVDEGQGSVLGANAIMGHDVLFDIDNQVLGWAESDCNYSSFAEDLLSGATDKRTNEPTHKPTNKPTHKPTNKPTHKPTLGPSRNETEDIGGPPGDQVPTAAPQNANESSTSVGCHVAYTIWLVFISVLVAFRFV